MNHARSVLALLLMFAQVGSGFDVSVSPETPRGGEGFLLTITGMPAGHYEITYRGKTYLPFDNGEGKKEIYLPLGIEERGTKKIKIVELKPGSKSEEKEISFDVRARAKRIAVLKTSDGEMRDRQPMVEKQNALVLGMLAYQSNEKRWDSGFLLPLDSPVSTPFAVHRKGQGYSYYHKGVDFSAPRGTRVKAINRGNIIFNEKNLNVYGNTLMIDHGHGVISCYFHLNRTFKSVGENVEKGEVIAEVGSSGWATGPHLHLGVYLQGEAVDPQWWTGFTNGPARPAAPGRAIPDPLQAANE